MDYVDVNRPTYRNSACGWTSHWNLSGGNKYPGADTYIPAETFCSIRGICFRHALVFAENNVFYFSTSEKPFCLYFLNDNAHKRD